MTGHTPDQIRLGWRPRLRTLTPVTLLTSVAMLAVLAGPAHADIHTVSAGINTKGPDVVMTYKTTQSKGKTPGTCLTRGQIKWEVNGAASAAQEDAIENQIDRAAAQSTKYLPLEMGSVLTGDQWANSSLLTKSATCEDVTQTGVHRRLAKMSRAGRIAAGSVSALVADGAVYAAMAVIGAAAFPEFAPTPWYAAVSGCLAGAVASFVFRAVAGFTVGGIRQTIVACVAEGAVVAALKMFGPALETLGTRIRALMAPIGDALGLNSVRGAAEIVPDTVITRVRADIDGAASDLSGR